VTILGWDMAGALPAQDDFQGIPRLRLDVKAHFVRGVWNFVHQIRWQAALLLWLARRRNEYDIVHACDFDTVLPALAAKRLWHKQVVYDIFDFYADMLRATPQVVKKLIRRVDIWAINQADALILADDSRVEQIFGASPKRCAIIYNCLDDLHKPEKVEAIPKTGLRLSYVGNLQVERGLLVLLDVLRKRPEIHLDLAGFGGDEQEILRVARNLPNVSWHGRVDYEQALLLNQGADTLIATYDPSIANHRYSSPNKVFEAMLLGKPVVVARGTNMDAIIEREGCGLVVEYGDADALEEALLRLEQDAGLRQHLGEQAHRAYLHTYNWQEMGRRLSALYEALQG
jgi:glycosyltransferase involved in cell wall biosynthesis